VAGKADDDLVDGLVQIEAAATNMRGQIEEILDLARLQVGRPLELNWRSADLVAVTRNLVAAQQATTERHQLRLDLEAPELLGEWDATRVERVMTNLLSNAIKYSPAGGEILVRLFREAHEDGTRAWAVLQVKDPGIGIPSVDLPRIFERFHRASNVRGRFAGTGIGLAGALRIVQLHGGELIVESEENAGTTVTMRLPLTDPED
jgi:signal transduction histidine kinase